MDVNQLVHNGAVDVASVVLAVLAFCQMTKPIIESIGTRFDQHFTSTMLHDAIIELYAVALTLGMVVWLQNAVLGGYSSSVDVGYTVIQVIIAVMTEFGIYGMLHPVPATPTTRFLAQTATYDATEGAFRPNPIRPVHPDELSVLEQELRRAIADAAQHSTMYLEARIAALEGELAAVTRRPIVKHDPPS